MSWFRVDDTFLEHPKLAPLEADPQLWADCVALWLAAGLYCARNGTDGFISVARLQRVSPLDPKRVSAACHALVHRARRSVSEPGLWVEVDGGYQFHDWAEYQPSAEKAREKRAKDRARLQKHRAKLAARHAATAHQETREDTGGETLPETRFDTGNETGPKRGPDPTRPDPISPIGDNISLSPGQTATDEQSDESRAGSSAKLGERAKDEQWSRRLIGHINARRSELGLAKPGARFDPLGKASLKLARSVRLRARDGHWTDEEVQRAIDLRIEAQRAAQRESWGVYVVPGTLLNTKLGDYVEQVRAGHTVNHQARQLSSNRPAVVHTTDFFDIAARVAAIDEEREHVFDA